jgi:RNA polymerase sigma-70 factor, ECF subfamily
MTADGSPPPATAARSAQDVRSTLRHGDRSSSQRTLLTESTADEELLERVGFGHDEDAFDMLYARYARAVYALVRRVLPGDPVSEEAAQDAFTAVWREAGGYHRVGGQAVDWMFAVTRAAAIDAGGARVPPQVPEPRNPPNGDRPDLEVMAELEAFHIHRALDSLPDPERNVVELTYFQGFAPNETAAHLDLPLVTAETLRRNGLRRMARMLGGVR